MGSDLVSCLPTCNQGKQAVPIGITVARHKLKWFGFGRKKRNVGRIPVGLSCHYPVLGQIYVAKATLTWSREGGWSLSQLL